MTTACKSRTTSRIVSVSVLVMLLFGILSPVTVMATDKTASTGDSSVTGEAPAAGNTTVAGEAPVPDDRPLLKIEFFHDNPCESCKTAEAFMENVDAELTRLGLQARVRYAVTERRTFRTDDWSLFQKRLDAFGVPAIERPGKRFAFFGTSWVSGTGDGMPGLGEALKKEIDLLGASKEHAPTETTPDGSTDLSTGSSSSADQSTVPGQSTSPDQREPDTLRFEPSEDVWITYFYTSPCSGCEAVAPLFEQWSGTVEVRTKNGPRQAPLHLDRYNISAPDNLLAARRFFEAWKVPAESQRVPIVFIGETWISGSEAILARLPGLLEDGSGLNKPVFEPNPPTTVTGSGTDSVQTAGKDEPGRMLSGYEVAGVFLTGLINGFNPCSMSMLLFFLSLLMARNARILRYGLAFLLGKFIAYLALGTAAYGLLEALGGSWFGRLQLVLKVVLAIVFIGLALANLSDFLAARNEHYNRIRMQLPAFLRKKSHGWLKRLAGVSDPRMLLGVSLLAGLVVSVGEFLCTGQIYLATILYVLHATGDLHWQAAGWFLLYVTGILLPLLVLTLALQKGKALFEVSEAVRQRMPLVKLITAIVFLAFAAVTVFVF